MTSKVVSIQDYNNNNSKKNAQIQLLLTKTLKYKEELDKLKSIHSGFKSGVVEHYNETKRKITNLNHIIKDLEHKIKTLESENNNIRGSYEVLKCDNDNFNFEQELNNIMKPLKQEYKTEYEKLGRDELFKLLSS